MKGVAIKYSPQELTWVKANQKSISRKELTARFNRLFGRTVSVDNISSLCLRKGWLNGNSGHFEKGFTPWNKDKRGYMGANATSFRKGNIPHNHRPVGSIRTNADGYKEIKVAEPNKWELMHRVEWKKHHGEIKKGHVIVFKDGDVNNTHIDNLMQVSNGALAITNHQMPNSKIKETAYLIGEVKYQIGVKSNGK